MSVDKEFTELFARLEDLKKRAARGDLGMSAFLSPRELYYAEDYLRRSDCRYFAFGGYADAERRRIYVLPEYMENVTDAGSLAEFGYQSGIETLKIITSGFVELSHRAFMGSLLALGIERSVLGDIVLMPDGAVVFCDKAMSGFLLEALQRVGRDKVKTALAELPADFSVERRYLPISDTVASPRLDCVVAALCSLSRERAKSAVEGGLVELNYEAQDRADREVAEQSVISVRGYGKFRVLSLNDKTRKGRYRLSAEKFL